MNPLYSFQTFIDILYLNYKNKIIEPWRYNKISTTINSLYQRNIVMPWPSSSLNAKLVVKNAFYFNNIFSMLNEIIFCDELCLHKVVDLNLINSFGLNNWNLQQFSFFSTHQSKEQYFGNLYISRFTYTQFVISALVRLFADNFSQKEMHSDTNLFGIMSWISPILLANDEMSWDIITILRDLKVVSYFPKPCIDAFLHYLDFAKVRRITNVSLFINKSSWVGCLELFSHFPVSFNRDCVRDCFYQNSLLPLYISLLHYELSLLVGKEKESSKKYLEFVKQTIVNENLLSISFLTKCEEVSFYPSFKNDFENLLQSVAAGIPIALFLTFGSARMLNGPLLNESVLQRPFSESRSQTGPGLRSGSFNRGAVTMRSLQNSNRVLQPLDPTYLPVHDIQKEDPKIITIDRLNREFEIEFYKINGKSYYSYYGINAQYQHLDKLWQALDKELNTLFPNSQNISSLFTRKIANLVGINKNSNVAENDHFSTITLRDAFSLDVGRCYATIVPGFLNSMRTNESSGLLPFVSYDLIRDKKSLVVYTLRTLLEKANDEAFSIWIYEANNRYPNDFNIIELIANSMARGFQSCLEHDLMLMNQFLNRFDVTVDDPESIMVLSNELHRVAEVQILADYHTQFNKYEIGKTKLANMNFVIEQLITKEKSMQEISLELQNFTFTNKYSTFTNKYKSYLQCKRQDHLENFTQYVKSHIHTLHTNNDPFFDSTRAEKALTNFFQERPLLKASPTLLAHSNLGNLFPGGNNNGTAVNYSVKAAELAGKNETGDINFFIRPKQQVQKVRKKTSTRIRTGLNAVFEAADNILSKLIATESMDNPSALSTIQQLKPDWKERELARWRKKNAEKRNIKEKEYESKEDPFKTHERKTQADLKKLDLNRWP